MNCHKISPDKAFITKQGMFRAKNLPELWHFTRAALGTLMTFSMSAQGIDLDSWYSIGNLESHTYERAECCPYAGFFCMAYCTFSWSLVFNFCLPVDVVVVVGVWVQVGRDQQWQKEHNCMGEQHPREKRISSLKRIGFLPWRNLDFSERIGFLPSQELNSHRYECRWV